jgi:hypothetical protein
MTLEHAANRSRRRQGRRTHLAFALVAAATVITAGLSPALSTSASAATPCQPGSNGALFVTETCVDPQLAQPTVDLDQPRSTTDPASGVTVTYRYVHGYFADHPSAKFTFDFPAADAYQGRFFESTYPTVSTEDADPATIAFAISNGAYVVSTNNDGGVAASPVLGGYRVNAAAAKFSRTVAGNVYGTSARPRGYIYGGSGGAYQTLGAMENTSGVWDGGVPFVPGVPNAIPSFATVELLALRVLHDKLPQIADAMEPGGSGDPYAGLTPYEQSILHEASRLGFPLRGWWQYATLGGGSFAVTEIPVRLIDPTYVNDFWAPNGYWQQDDPSVQNARIQYGTTVQSAAGINVTLTSVPAGDLLNADLVITSGPAAGKSATIVAVNGNTLTLLALDPSVYAALAALPSVQVDNSWVLALQYYQRHQVPTPDQYGWNQYRDASGNPLYPQRPFLVGPILAGSAGGAVATGNFHGKMIMLAMTMDVQAYPWSADWYRKQAQTFLGSSLDSNYRLWYMDNADHQLEGSPLQPDHIVGYDGEIQQALLYLDSWVRNGVQPPPTTNYTIDADNQVQLPANAQQRNGVQPVVDLSARAKGAPSDSIDVAVGQPVTFQMAAKMPSNTGRIVKVEWDFEGTTHYTVQSALSHVSPASNVRETYTFTRPGTYFTTVRVTANQTGDLTTPFGLVPNLARVRIVVH